MRPPVSLMQIFSS